MGRRRSNRPTAGTAKATASTNRICTRDSTNQYAYREPSGPKKPLRSNAWLHKNRSENAATAVMQAIDGMAILATLGHIVAAT